MGIFCYKLIKARTHPHIVVVTATMLQLGTNLDVIISAGRVLQRKELNVALQRIQHLPCDQNHQVHDQKHHQHRVQLPRIFLQTENIQLIRTEYDPSFSITVFTYLLFCL